MSHAQLQATQENRQAGERQTEGKSTIYCSYIPWITRYKARIELLQREVELLKGMAAEPMWQFDKTGADTIQTPRGSWNVSSSVLIGFTRLVNMV
jgi:hypothetical protein